MSIEELRERVSAERRRSQGALRDERVQSVARFLSAQAGWSRDRQGNFVPWESLPKASRDFAETKAREILTSLILRNPAR